MAKAKVKGSPKLSTEEQLARYRSMRDFAVTDEPSGKDAARRAKTAAAAGALPFVIQKHAATRLASRAKPAPVSVPLDSPAPATRPAPMTSGGPLTPGLR